ncbi:prepilin-type N-terminal cleavage/methylation domain-containing protein [Candidatus Gottesmanbacteria bacterium]|nr:prepilin-type N-terminal cleavage/methylation domain-containing protein [Candidatus Gottesmanbacteria bacterium]
MKKGFTLIEVLVVATIIGVLTAVAVTSYTSVNKRSRDSKRRSDLEQLRSALEMYRSDNSYYPPVDVTGFGNVGDLTSYLVPSYMPGIPSDPSTTQAYYYYATNQSGTNYYGYCLCAKLETIISPINTCSVSLPAACNFGTKSP